MTGPFVYRHCGVALESQRFQASRARLLGENGEINVGAIRFGQLRYLAAFARSAASGSATGHVLGSEVEGDLEAAKHGEPCLGTAVDMDGSERAERGNDRVGAAQCDTYERTGISPDGRHVEHDTANDRVVIQVKLAIVHNQRIGKRGAPLERPTRLRRGTGRESRRWRMGGHVRVRVAYLPAARRCRSGEWQRRPTASAQVPQQVCVL